MRRGHDGEVTNTPPPDHADHAEHADHGRHERHDTEGWSVDPASAFEPEWWEEHYRQHGTGSAEPSPYVASAAAGLKVGRALDAGCGSGADAIWLARQGWTVTAVDVSPTVVAAAEAAADPEPPEVGGRLSWVAADSAAWSPPQEFDLVVSQYVHPGIAFSDFVSRLARVVAVGGTLLVVGHDHDDAHASAHAPEAASIGPETVTDALSPVEWEIAVAETRTRHVARGSDRPAVRDTVVRARRRIAP